MKRKKFLLQNNVAESARRQQTFDHKVIITFLDFTNNDLLGISFGAKYTVAILGN